MDQPKINETKKTKKTNNQFSSEEKNFLAQELENEKNRHLRTLADFDNYRKRVERDAQIRNTAAKKALLVDLLDLLDHVEQARRQPLGAQTAEGLDLIHRQFVNLLEKHGVIPIECLGAPFNPAEQEGVSYLETTAYPEGCVAEEVRRGYRFGGEILRPARVLVAKQP
jgi:molecular chaperone GrpE